MRIPLDYYRILGLPIQATAEQRSQAYRDRALQLPRREYSEAAIASRKQLLDEAYAVLSDPEKCAVYDASFLAKTYEQQQDQSSASFTSGTNKAVDGHIDLHTPSIEIKTEQLVGALLILQELGEYELVLKLGQPYLGTRDSISLDKGRLGDPHIIRPDIVLTVALACLELGREQWQQGQYENAATSLESGQEILLREGLFPAVRGEIQADLYKLRPYRILELLALPEENLGERRNGLRLLQEMLQERLGIDGTGDDQSGLSIDDFLRFIQQLRGYLSAAEQQNLFEAEARRPSAVATYLAVYALLARGFAQRQPALIARAKQMLMRLGRRQDVHLEQSVCALLLGQTEEASKALELSQEYEPLAFIREHSQGAPDLLPGLCLYGERWLQKSVFPHFRDLRNQKASLKEYFADEQVQAYLESLPEPASDSNNEWSVVQAPETTYATPQASRGVREPIVFRRPDSGPVSAASDSLSGGSLLANSQDERVVLNSEWGVGREPAALTSSRMSTVGETKDREPANHVSSLPTSGRGTRTSATALPTVTGLAQDSVKPPRGGLGEAHAQRSPRSSTHTDSTPGTSSDQTESLKRLPPGRSQRLQEKSKSSKKVKRLVFLTIAGLVGLGVLGLLVRSCTSSSAPDLIGEQPLVEITKPPIPIPQAGSELLAPDGPLTEETGAQVIQTWLSTKSAALGSEHKIDQFSQVLAEPALSTWRQRAQTAKQDNSYWQYKHSLKVNSVKTFPGNPDRARVEAAVNEAAQLYQGGQLNSGASYNENLRVQYELVRKDGRWLIKDMGVMR